MPTRAEYQTARANFMKNDRVRLIRVSVPADACPVCLSIQGAYPKDGAPRLPPEGCSCVPACRSFYEPVLAEIYP